MKKSLLSLCFLIIALSLVAQTGKVMDNLTMTSKILKMERKYAVYLPPTMNRRKEATRSYTFCMEPAMIRPAGSSSAKSFILPTGQSTEDLPHP